MRDRITQPSSLFQFLRRLRPKHVHRFENKATLWEPSLYVCRCGEIKREA